MLLAGSGPVVTLGPRRPTGPEAGPPATRRPSLVAALVAGQHTANLVRRTARFPGMAAVEQARRPRGPAPVPTRADPAPFRQQRERARSRSVSQPPKQPSFPKRHPPALVGRKSPRPQRPSTRARWIVLAVLGSLLVAGCIVVMVRVTTAPTATSEHIGTGGGLSATGRVPVPVQPVATPRARTQDPPGIGKQARDGAFVFMVRTLDCSRTLVGTAAFGRRAQGRFCLLGVRVANVGKTPPRFEVGRQYGYDRAGRRYEPDDEAGLYLQDANR